MNTNLLNADLKKYYDYDYYDVILIMKNITLMVNHIFIMSISVLSYLKSYIAPRTELWGPAGMCGRRRSALARNERTV